MSYVPLTITVGSDTDPQAVGLTGPELPVSGRLSTDRRLRDTVDVLKKLLLERRLQNREEFELLGSCLFDYLFVDDVRNQFGRYLSDLKAGDVLRIVLVFDSDYGGLVEVPWEYLHIPADFHHARSGFIAAREELILSRRIRLKDARATLNPSSERLRIFVGIASPTKERVPRWADGPGELVDLPDVKKLAVQLTGKLDEESWAEVRVEQALTGKRLRKMLEDTAESFRPHVVHLVAHGDFDVEGTGSLALCSNDDPRQAAWTRDSDIADCFRHIPGVVFLHACSSARSGKVHGFRGVAMRLVSRGVPAVVGMNFEIDEGMAYAFALRFYRELALGKPIDQAVQLGRNEIGEMKRARGNYSERAFGSPVAFVQVSESVLRVVPPPQTADPQDVGEAKTLAECPVCTRKISARSQLCLWCRKDSGRITRLEPCPSPTCPELWSPPLGVCVFCSYEPSPEPPSTDAVQAAMATGPSAGAGTSSARTSASFGGR